MILKVVRLLLAGSLIAVQAWGASPKPATGDRFLAPTNWVPFPWAKELPISQASAQGVWSVTDGHTSSYFYVKVTRDRTRANIRYLSVIEKDGYTCDVVATGFGTENVSTRVSAVMTTTHGQKYTMMLRLFDANGVPNGGHQAIQGKVMVLTVSHHDTRKSYNYPMAKLSDRTEFTCIPKR